MMSMYMMKRVPFKKAYIHGLVRDEKGQKMSKSKGNTVDPMETIEKYGADALRFFMAAMETQGRDVNLSEARIAGYRNFATKLWNAARFGEMNECRPVAGFDETKVQNAVNKWIIARAKEATREVTENLNNYRFSDAANAVYQFVWGSFCDWYIEMSKPILYGDDDAAKAETRGTFAWVLERILVILHPFMPFITTELWSNEPHDVKLIHASWPSMEEIDENAMRDIDWVIEMITAVRSLRASMNIPAAAKLAPMPPAARKDVQLRLINAGIDTQNSQCRMEQIIMRQRLLQIFFHTRALNSQIICRRIAHPNHKRYLNLPLRRPAIRSRVQINAVFAQRFAVVRHINQRNVINVAELPKFIY